MIKQIYSLDGGALSPLNPIQGRISTYYEAYGAKLPFCSFFMSDGITMMRCGGEIYADCKDNADTHELCLFLSMYQNPPLYISGADDELVTRLSDMGYTPKLLNLCIAKTEHIRTPDIPICDEADYRAAFEILKSGFGFTEDSFALWYTDLCHRVRHGVSRLFLLPTDGAFAATATAVYQKRQAAFLSHIAVKEELRSMGLGKRLLCGTAQRLESEYAMLLCRDRVLGFYQSCGFEKSDEKYFEFT